MKRLARYPLLLADRVVDRIVGLVGALSASQGPGFIAQYQQRLGGHLAEAERNLSSWLDVAHRASMDSVQQLINVYGASGSAEVVEAGVKCAADLARASELRAASAALQGATAWERPLLFLRHMDSDIVRDTMAMYVPNLPLDVEGGIYALCGLSLGLGAYVVIKRFSVATARAARRRRKSSSAELERDASDQALP